MLAGTLIITRVLILQHCIRGHLEDFVIGVLSGFVV